MWISPNVLSLGDIGITIEGVTMEGVLDKDSFPRTGDSRISSSNGDDSGILGTNGGIGTIIVDRAVVGSDGTDEIVDKTLLDTGAAEIEIGILSPRPVVAAGALVARDRSASATFSAVSCGTAGIGLEVGLPNVIILGCARTATGTGAAAMIAVERYALVAIEPRVYVVPTESRLEYVVSRFVEYIVSRAEYVVSRYVFVARLARRISSAEKNWVGGWDRGDGNEDIESWVIWCVDAESPDIIVPRKGEGM